MESVGFEHLRMEEVYNKRTLFFNRGIGLDSFAKYLQPVLVGSPRGGSLLSPPNFFMYLPPPFI